MYVWISRFCNAGPRVAHTWQLFGSRTEISVLDEKGGDPVQKKESWQVCKMTLLRLV